MLRRRSWWSATTWTLTPDRRGSLTTAPMSPTPIEESRAELASLAQRLRQHDAEGAALDRDLAAATERGRAARLSMEEMAQRAGVTRQTLYTALRRAKEHTQKGRPGKRRPTRTPALNPATRLATIPPSLRYHRYIPDQDPLTSPPQTFFNQQSVH